ncbi:hypothetical protein J3L16_15885, partial [Alteromonas sp. 5E99-2]|uniref:phosphopantetheine-binding protein n=1 Tax=Alteromonas sp. 5E99-2 TaxID=2817683 RepID=UPI001A98403A
LPAPELANINTYEAPEGDTEIALAGIWQEVLGVEQVGRHDNFFALGGHSLAVMQVKSEIHKQTGYELSVRNLFETPNISSLASSLPSDLFSKDNEKSKRVAKMASLFEEFEI